MDKDGGALKTKWGEIRHDITTDKWVVIAKARADRPYEYASVEAAEPLPRFKKDCPLCDLDRFPQAPDVLRLPDDPDRWQVHIFANKYPAFSPKDDFRNWKVGPYRVMEAVGYHELLATRWHDTTDAQATQAQLSLQLEALLLRYRQLKAEPAVSYIQVIKNYGKNAGASLAHPHHQIFTTPMLPNDIHDKLHGGEKYFKKHDKSVYQVLLDFERSSGERIVYENELFTALCPYASRMPFEVWIVPRHQEPFFENVGPAEREALAEIMQQVFRRIHKALNDPAYNYYIQSAPCDDEGFVCDAEQFKHFRWHIEIVPRLGHRGGFELGTGLDINPSVPEECAKILRDQRIHEI